MYSQRLSFEINSDEIKFKMSIYIKDITFKAFLSPFFLKFIKKLMCTKFCRVRPFQDSRFSFIKN